MTDTWKTAPGLKFAIQCKETESEKVGTFIYDERRPFFAVSPVWRDCVEAFDWMHKHGYRVRRIDDIAVEFNGSMHAKEMVRAFLGL